MAITTARPTAPLRDDALPAVRRIGSEDLDWALAQGWRDFYSKRGDLVIAGLLYTLIGLAAAAVAVNAELMPLLFPTVAGISILGPAVASGFYEIARRREAGLESDWPHFLDPLRGRSRMPLALLTVGLGGLFIGWLVVAWAIYEATLGPLNPTGTRDFLALTFGTPQGWAMIVLGNLAGFVFAAVTLVVSVVSFPMVIDRPASAGDALATSLRAVRANPGTTARWGLRVAGLLLLGCLPAFIGLAVVLPVLGYATWHLYTRAVERG